MKKTFIDADFELIVLENCVVLTSGVQDNNKIGTEEGDWD